MSTVSRVLRVGVIGAGEVAQNARHCADKFRIPVHMTDPQDIFARPDINAVFILTSDEYHEEYTIRALESGKHVMVEKPLSLSIPSVQRIIAAEEKANGPRVFVGYMRRYASTFLNTFMREVASIPRILYARSRDFSGPNAKFVAESGTFQVKNTDFPTSAADERAKRLQALFKEAFPNQSITAEHEKACRFLGSLGSHDISLLREVVGMPESVSGVSFNDPFYSAILNYRNKTGEPFSVTYESGIDAVPDFDAHLAIYGENKRVLIKYDTPYVKGLAIKVIVQELNEFGEITTRESIGSYEDAYTSELHVLYDCIVNGKKVKTTAKDALQDLQIYDMMYQRWQQSVARD